MTMTVGDIIMAALNVLRKQGWTVHTRHDPLDRMCALGAFERLHGINHHTWHRTGDSAENLEPEALAALAAAVPGKGPVPPHWAASQIGNYNNSRTSFAEIEEWFEKAALNEGITQ